MRAPYRIGVDVGGTNTDSVLLDARKINEESRGVIAWQKTETTSPNVTDGIETAVRSVLEQSNVSYEEVGCLIIGTTHFINAIVEHDARRLSKVAVIRLTKSFTKEVPPFSDFPPVLKKIMNGYYGYVDGGLNIDGSEEAPIKEDQIIEQCRMIKKEGIKEVVISGIFSPIDEHFNQEHRLREIVQREIPGVDVVCSSDVSQIGLLERENASILNASILNFARRTIDGFRVAMKKLNLQCALYLTQNDGTLIDAPSAARLPIRTFSSGPTNSMRGAAYLGLGNNSEKTTTLVVDIGGTTTDVGVLLPSGFPRQRSAYVTVAGVRINFAMPHIESIGLGGGSIVREQGSKVTVGPDSVGHHLTSKARVFGGDTLTATDIVVAAGEKVGNPALVKGLDREVVSKAQLRMKAMLERVIDVVKTSPAPLPVLLVGGGSFLAPSELDGVSKVICPPFHSVANAVGAAMSKVGGLVDMIQSTSHTSEAEVKEKAKAMAVERAVAAGALRETVYVAELDALPIAYMANQVRVIARAVGDLSPDGALGEVQANLFDTLTAGAEKTDDIFYDQSAKKEVEPDPADLPPNVNPQTYKPTIVKNPETGINEWLVSETDVAWLADGCYVLGCAGGGSPFVQYLRIRDQIRQGHRIRIIDADDLKDNGVVYWGGHLGSPAVSVERLASDETEQAFLELMEYFRHESFDAVMCLEIGGGNGVLPLAIGSSKNHDTPAVDADWMGRAYPTYCQITLAVYESHQLCPCAFSSGNGNTIFMTKAATDEIVDRALRASCAEMGSLVGLAARPTTTEKVKKYSVRNTMSLAWRLGRCIARAHANNTVATVAEQMVHECGGPSSAKILFKGKIISVERRLYKGHSYGEVTIQQTKESDEEMEQDGESAADQDPASIPVVTGGFLQIPFKNENIYAKHVSETGEEQYVASVPDLISVLDKQSGRALGVPEFRYGVMVTVLGIACSPRWNDTDRGLEVGGPGAFGYDDIKYKPLGTYTQPRSVIREFQEV